MQNNSGGDFFSDWLFEENASRNETLSIGSGAEFLPYLIFPAHFTVAHSLNCAIRPRKCAFAFRRRDVNFPCRLLSIRSAKAEGKKGSVVRSRFPRQIGMRNERWKTSRSNVGVNPSLGATRRNSLLCTAGNHATNALGFFVLKLRLCRADWG